MIMIKRIRLIYTFIFTMLIIACSRDSDNQETFDLKQLRADLINTVGNPTTKLFIENIQNLHSAIVTLSNTISVENLHLAKKAWKNTAIAFSAIEPYNFAEVKNSNIQTAFYSWDANDTGINEYINSNKTIDEESINSLSTTLRGLSAIEFLLFNGADLETIDSFSNSRRIKYLTVLGKNLVSKAEVYKTLWKITTDNFIENRQTGIHGSINQVVNQIYALLEDIKSFKIGQPAGIEKTNIPDIEKLQAEKSKLSLTLIQKNLESIRKLYFGNVNGLDDYIFSETKNNDLNEKIAKTFTEIENIITDFEGQSLEETIFQKPNEVTSLYTKIRYLLLLMKIDVANVLSITISVTDNDGD